MTPRPRINLVIYHGILAPHARVRARAVAHGPAKPTVEEGPSPTEEPGAGGADAAPEPAGAATSEAPPDESRPRIPERPREWAWAELMRRVFDVDVLACPRCGSRMAVIATIEAGDVTRKILNHLGLPTDPPTPLPAHPPPLAADLFPDSPA